MLRAQNIGCSALCALQHNMVQSESSFHWARARSATLFAALSSPSGAVMDFASYCAGHRGKRKPDERFGKSQSKRLQPTDGSRSTSFSQRLWLKSRGTAEEEDELLSTLSQCIVPSTLDASTTPSSFPALIRSPVPLTDASIKSQIKFTSPYPFTCYSKSATISSTTTKIDPLLLHWRLDPDPNHLLNKERLFTGLRSLYLAFRAQTCSTFHLYAASLWWCRFLHTSTGPVVVFTRSDPALRAALAAHDVSFEAPNSRDNDTQDTDLHM